MGCAISSPTSPEVAARLSQGHARAITQAVTDQSGNGVAGGVNGVNGDGGDTRALLEDKGEGKGEGKGDTEGVVTNNDVDGQAVTAVGELVALRDADTDAGMPPLSQPPLQPSQPQTQPQTQPQPQGQVQASRGGEGVVSAVAMEADAAAMEESFDALSLRDGNLQGLSNLGLTALPTRMVHDSELLLRVRVLFLDRNNFEELPDLTPLYSLEKLNMFSNAVRRVHANRLPRSLEILELNSNQITAIDETVFSALPYLCHLDLCANLLTDAAFAAPAEELQACSTLRFVDITSNRLTAFPPQLLLLHGLYELRLSLNPLKVVHAELSLVTSLVALQAAMCELSVLPDTLCALRGLCMLDVSRNGLTKLPNGFSRSPLRELKVSHNRLAFLPISLGTCSELRVVDATHNAITTFPDELCRLTKLEKLLLHHNKIAVLQKSASSLKMREHSLKEIDLSHNELQSVHNVAFECRELRLGRNPLCTLDGFRTLRVHDLHISNTGLTNVLPHLDSIEQLHAPNNQITSIKWPRIANCANTLRVLNLASNLLVSLPAEIGELQKLQELLLGCNFLEGLPSGCANLRRLKVLHLGCNSLVEVPKPCLELPQLEWLHLGSNQISELPAAISRMESLQSLLLNDNHLTSLDVVLPDSLVELDISQNRIGALPWDFRIPAGGVYWGNKLKRPYAVARDRHKGNAGAWLLGGGNRSKAPAAAADGADPNKRPPAERRATQMPPKMQPFRMYVHGNPMEAPAPHLLAHTPGEELRKGEMPRPAERRPRGSGIITLVDYDGAVWPSEAALHVELLREPSADKPASRVRFGVAEMQGRKLRMEDSVCVQRCFRGRPDEAFFAVFDGHAGSSDVAEDAAAFLGEELAAQLGDGPLPADAQVANALRAAFLSINERLRQRQPVGGAVAVVVLLHITAPGEGVVHCANVGDARSVLCVNGKARRLSRDFKALDPDEHARIRDLGGWVSLRSGGRVCDVLCPCRSLGDFMLAKYIKPVAHVVHEKIKFNECPFVTLCCDGVWDVLTDQEAVDMLLTLKGNYARGAGLLRDAAFLSGSTDNISALVVDLAAAAENNGKGSR